MATSVSMLKIDQFDKKKKRVKYESALKKI